jgi:hypothetical protein
MSVYVNLPVHSLVWSLNTNYLNGAERDYQSLGAGKVVRLSDFASIRKRGQFLSRSVGCS